VLGGVAVGAVVLFGVSMVLLKATVHEEDEVKVVESTPVTASAPA